MISAIIARLGLALVMQATAPPAQEDPSHRSLRSLIREMMHPDAPKVGYLPDTASRWVDRNRQALVGIKPAPLAEQPWGLSALRAPGEGKPSAVYLYVFDWHASGMLVVYGVSGGVQTAYLWSDPNQTSLPIARLNNSLVISGPKTPPDRLVSIVVLETKDKLEMAETVVRPAAGGALLLHARDAVVHGRVVRYEPEPHKNTLGYWTDPADRVSWQFEVAEPGVYRVEILQGCGKGIGGSKVNFGVGEQVLTVTVEDTGGFQNFVSRDIGTLRFEKPGQYAFTVKPIDKLGAAVMDLRQVTLTPVKP